MLEGLRRSHPGRKARRALSRRHQDRSTALARHFGLFAMLLVTATTGAKAANFDNSFNTTNDFGDVGLMQTPSARMRADGEFGIGISTVYPYSQVHIFLQPLPWVETAVRYTQVSNRLYGAEDFSGNQSYKDKSADFKIHLLSEGEYQPSLALGVQDIGGTGLFSGEYLVGGYHYYSLDFSFGLGWGRLGSGGSIRNPLGLLSNHFDNDRTTSAAGSTGFSRLFTGRDIGPFGGVQWLTPLKGLALQIEYDGNDYQHEALGNNRRQSSRINVALNYRNIPGMDVGIGYERGNTVMARVSLHLNFQDFRGVFKSADPLPIRVRPAEQSHPAQSLASSPDSSSGAVSGAESATSSANPAAPASAAPLESPPVASAPVLKMDHQVSTDKQAALAIQLKTALHDQGFELAAMNYDVYSGELQVWTSRRKFRNPAQAAGRLARVLSALSPPEVARFTLIHIEAGLEVYRISLPREEFEKVMRGQAAPTAIEPGTVLSGPDGGYDRAKFIDATQAPAFSWDAGPAIRQYIGGPDNFYIGQLFVRFDGGIKLTDHWSFSAAAGVNVINNFGELKQMSNSVLPHVRSDIVEYLKDGQNGIIKVETNYIWSPMPDLYARVSGGIFEEMYAGVAGELLYRPYGWPWALGVDVNRVWQRGYDQLLDFRDYSVATGFVTLYYQLPVYDVLAKLTAGRYLARDKGATLDLSREFANGIRAGAWATKTNVSAAQFGEGSFDKGIYLVVPLDLFFPQSTRRVASFPFRPLTRDGGQRARDGIDLYGIVEQGQPRDFAADWGGLGQ